MYEHKYIKYKKKYAAIKKSMIGGNNTLDEDNYDPTTIISPEQYDTFKYLFGPISLYIIKNNLNTIYLYGDQHVYSTDVNMTDKIYLPDYLEKMFSNNFNTQFDLFIELPYTTSKKIGKVQTGLIENINKKFNVCFRNLADKFTCREKYPNVRFHAIDLRKYYEESTDGYTLFGYYTRYANILREHENDLNQLLTDLINGQINENEYIKLFKEHLDILFRFFDEKTIYRKEDLIHSIKQMLVDEINKFSKYYSVDSDFNKIFNEYFEQKSDKLYEKYTKMMRLYDNISEKEKNGFFGEILEYGIENKQYNIFRETNIVMNELLNAVIDYVDDINIVVMDIYCLFRMIKCRKYDKYCKNIIVIAGYNHITNYLSFLTKHYDYSIKYSKQSRALELITETAKIRNAYNDNKISDFDLSLMKLLYIRSNPSTRFIDVTKNELEEFITQ
jgi:hypothetical protein